MGYNGVVVVLQVLCGAALTRGSVTILSEETVSVYESNSITLYCQIEPFDFKKCHRWYRQSLNGSIWVVAEGSYLYETQDEIKIGDSVNPQNLSLYHDNLFSVPCQQSYEKTAPVPTSDPEVQSNQSTAASFSLTTTQTLKPRAPLVTLTKTLSTAAKVTRDPTRVEKYYPSRHESYYMLTITKLNKQDEGKYFCQYYCQECDSRKSKVIFTAPASLSSLRLTSEPDVEFVEIGDMVKLTCEVTSRPQAVLRWVLVLNGVSVPHMEDVQPSRVVRNPVNSLFTVTSIFQFKGGHVNKNPFVIYCQVVSPVESSALIDRLEEHINEQQVPDHKHKRKKRDTKTYDEHDHASHSDKNVSADYTYTYADHDHDDEFHYQFEPEDRDSDHHESQIHYQYLTTFVFRRKVYRMPTAAIEGKWRTALIVLCLIILLLPILMGFVQIFLRKTEGFHFVHEKRIQDYYKIARSKRDNSQTEEIETPNDKP